MNDQLPQGLPLLVATFSTRAAAEAFTKDLHTRGLAVDSCRIAQVIRRQHHRPPGLAVWGPALAAPVLLSVLQGRKQLILEHRPRRTAIALAAAAIAVTLSTALWSFVQLLSPRADRAQQRFEVTVERHGGSVVTGTSAAAISANES